MESSTVDGQVADRERVVLEALAVQLGISSGAHARIHATAGAG